MQFEWDDANEAHIASHGVTKDEVEAVVADPFGESLDSEVIDDETRYRHIGSTENDRISTVIFTVRGDAVRPVTAFEATRYMARRYKEGSIQ